jgi:hypothetical protein
MGYLCMPCGYFRQRTSQKAPYAKFAFKEFCEVHAEACNLAMSRPTPTSVLALVRAMLHTSSLREEHRVKHQSKAQTIENQEVEQQSRLQTIEKRVWWLVGAVAVLAILFVINRFFIHHPLWDWIELLIVPAILTGGGLVQHAAESA